MRFRIILKDFDLAKQKQVPVKEYSFDKRDEAKDEWCRLRDSLTGRQSLVSNFNPEGHD